jgi:hypothetical protein
LARRVRQIGKVALGAVLLLVTPVVGEQAPDEAQAQAPAPAAPPARSPRNANYTIDVRLDPEARVLDGRQVLRWTNIKEQPTDELWFHLYWNAWRNDRSTWMIEDRLRGRSDRGDDIREEDWGTTEVLATRLLPDGAREGADLTVQQRFAAPDDGNRHDRTVLVVPLPFEVAPGETVELEMAWRSRIPRTFARTGFRGNYFFLAHWFPKLGVFEGEAGWNCHQFHAQTEFFSDYGVYDVSMTVPDGFVLGATGREVERRDNGDGTTTYRHVQEDVHAFTWTASRSYLVRERRFEVAGLPPIDMRLLIQPEHQGQAGRHFAAAAAAFEHYGTWYGPYPYGHVTLVDPAWGSGAGGMEYPTLFTCGTRLYNPEGTDSPESVTVHEAGHQFWYGLVGNNEFEHAWLDEGLNTFSTLRTLDEAYGPRLLSRRYLRPPGGRGRRSGFLPLRFHDIEVPRLITRLDDFRGSAAADVPARPTFRYLGYAGADLSYSKTALWLATLERHLGWDTLQAILSTFFERHRFGHPTPEDFFRIADEVSGQDLAWFFDQVHRGSAVFDYAVSDVASRALTTRGMVGEEGALTYTEPEEGDEDGRYYRTEVIVRRLGDGVFPVEVRLVFEDGHETRRTWDGSSRWELIVAEHPAKLEYAVVDPGRVLMLDVNYTNNSLRREPAARLPAAKWSSKWMLWLQERLLHFEFFL